MTSKQVILNTNQMAFFIYNLFGHDITHDGHPSGLGEGRFSSAIRSLSDTAKGVMNRKGGKKKQIGGNPQDEIQYYQSIGEMTSRNSLLYSVGNELITNGMLYAANIPRNSTNEKVWQDITFIIIDVKTIIDNFNNGKYYDKDVLYPGFVYFNDEVISPYDIVVSSTRAPGGLGGKQYKVSFPGKNFEVLITDTSIDSIILNYESQTISYLKVNNENFQGIINALSDEFFYTSFSDYMKTTSYIDIDGLYLYFVSYILKKTGPTQNAQNFFTSIIQFTQSQNIANFTQLVSTFSLYKEDYNSMYNLFASKYLKREYNEGVELDTMAEIFIGQIEQLPNNFNNEKSILYQAIVTISSDQTNNLLNQLSSALQQTNPDAVNYIILLVNFFVISRLYLNTNTSDLKDDADSMSGGGPKISYEQYVVQPGFIDMVVQGFNESQIQEILHPTNLENIVGIIETKFANYVELINNFIPRDILPLDFAQRLYGAQSRPSLNINAILSFLIKSVPSEADINCLTELDKYKRFLYNDPTTVTEIKLFVEDLIKLLENKNDLNPDVILSLLIGYNKPELQNKLLSIFVQNVSGVVQISTEKKAKQQIGVLSNFEQYIIRQIRIALLYLLTPQRYTIPKVNVDAFFTNFTQALNVYSKIISIITLLYESAPGLTTLQKINSSYMISTAILAVNHNMNLVSRSLGKNYILDAQIKILSSIYLHKNVSAGKTGMGDIDAKLFTEFQKWISTGSKGAGDFAGSAGFVFNDNKLSDSEFWSSLGINQPFPENQLYYINNAVTAKVGIPPFFCPFSSIMDGQTTCNSLKSALKMNGVEYGTMDVIIRDGNVGGTTTGETMRYHVRVELVPGSSNVVQISAFLKIGNDVLINIGRLGSTPNSPQAEPHIVVDLNSKRSPLEASECLREIINVNVESLVNSDNSIKKWEDYLELINSNDTTPIVTTRSGQNITPQELRRRIVSASFRKSLGDYLQELNMTVENGGYVDSYSVNAAPGTTILPPNTFRLGLSNDRPSGIRIMLLLLFGQNNINPSSIGGFINPDGKYLIAIRNKKTKGGRFSKTFKKYNKKRKSKKSLFKKNKTHIYRKKISK